MKRKFLSILLTVILITAPLPVFPAFAQTVWDGSTKTEPVQKDGVYQIENGAQLAWFAEYINTLANEDTGLVDVDAVVTNDIDLGNQAWTPIGLTTYVTDAYAGVFDGQNHTVSGLKIDASSANYGLFSVVNTGTVKNLRVEGDVNSNHVVGGIIGKLQTGTVENCSMSGSVTTTGKSTKGYAGGITGTVAAKGAVVVGCCNSAKISGTYSGGIIGYNKNSADISCCYNTGDITGTSRSAGIAGQQSNGTISFCYNIGKSTNGIAGFSNCTITNCYYLNDEASVPGGTASGYEKIADKQSLLSDLNAGVQKLFSDDKININDGYPILTWQLSSSVLHIPVSVVKIIGSAVTGVTLTAQALGENGDNATNVQYKWTVSADAETFEDTDSVFASTFTIPDEADWAGKYIKLTASGEDNSIAYAIIGPVEKSESLIDTENKEKVQSALASLTLEKTVVKEKTVLNLPEQIGECSVRWESSNTEIISNSGAVTLPDKNIVTIQLKAYVTCGKALAVKSFDIDVWALDVEPAVYLQKVLDSMKWDFKTLNPVYGEDTNILVKFKNILNSRGFDGITVTVNSTADSTLVSQNGKLYYPSIPAGGSFADGKQVQVFFNLTVGDMTVIYPTSDSYSLMIPWDTSDVRTSLEKSADDVLKTDVLSADNANLDSVASELNLPSCIDGDRYSFAWITWESSDENYLFVSNENRQSGADSLYNAYVGKIYQDSEPHTVTLTAIVKNPSTDITVTRQFEVTIMPLSAEQTQQNISTMKAILNYYTADKLMDFTTKKQLDINAVDNDIQLVIPKNVVTPQELDRLHYGKYWDYWNYRFTVSSSDTDVIEINSFRANVYRPLGEDDSADRQVTLTVKMQSKANPNYYVTKDIHVTVKHLGRAEINNALELMDQAKCSYSTGLLGDNTDTYSIIDSLTPYKEIVWNTDKSGVEFVYRNSDMCGSGIVVDELPGWEEQEDYRLFRTSNRNLLSNETLILNYTPNDDTFIKINSVLTDEILGKYYTKFKDCKDYDAEALAKFKQLYKQPVSAYVMAVGAGNYTEEFAFMSESQKVSAYSASLSAYKYELDKPISVTFTLLGLDHAELIAKTPVMSFTSGSTVFDVFKKVLADNNMSYRARGSYISSINGLSEFDYGRSSGWMYTVGDVFVNSYMNAQELYGGEDIVVMYVTDYSLANKPADSDNNSSVSDDDGNNGNDNSNSGSGNNQNPSGDSDNGNQDNGINFLPPDTDKIVNTNDVEQSDNNGSVNNGNQPDGSNGSEDSVRSNPSRENKKESAQKADTPSRINENAVAIVDSKNAQAADDENENDNDKVKVNSTSAVQNSADHSVGVLSDSSADKNMSKSEIIAVCCVAAAAALAVIIIVFKKRSNSKEK